MSREISVIPAPDPQPTISFDCDEVSVDRPIPPTHSSHAFIHPPTEPPPIQSESPTAESPTELLAGKTFYELLAELSKLHEALVAENEVLRASIESTTCDMFVRNEALRASIETTPLLRTSIETTPLEINYSKKGNPKHSRHLEIEPAAEHIEVPGMIAHNSNVTELRHSRDLSKEKPFEATQTTLTTSTYVTGNVTLPVEKRDTTIARMEAQHLGLQRHVDATLSNTIAAVKDVLEKYAGASTAKEPKKSNKMKATNTRRRTIGAMKTDAALSAASPSETGKAISLPDSKELQGCLQKLKSADYGTVIDTVVGIVIFLNSVFLVVTFQHEGYMSAISLGIQEETNAWDNADTWFLVFEHVFNACFVIEFVVRIALVKLAYFTNWMNIFDFSIILISSLDLYVVQPLQTSDDEIGNLSILRFARLLKAVRALRMIRTLALFSELRVLVGTIYSSTRSLLVSMILLGICMMVSGVLLCQFVAEFVKDESNDYDTRMWAFTYYGSAIRATYTMFEVTLSGCWPNYARTLIEEIHPMYGFFFIFYVAWVVFAIIRVITAIFLKDTMDAATSDAEMMAVQQMYKKQQYMARLRALFDEADSSGDGVLNYDEFEEILHNPKVKVFLQILGLEIHETKMLFNLMDEGDGEITVDEFMFGVSRLKGQSKAIDVVAIQRDVDIIRTDMLSLISKFEEIFGTPIQMSVQSRKSQVQKGLSANPSRGSRKGSRSPAAIKVSAYSGNDDDEKSTIHVVSQTGSEAAFSTSPDAFTTNVQMSCAAG